MTITSYKNNILREFRNGGVITNDIIETKQKYG